jgi:hypothetical protein
MARRYRVLLAVTLAYVLTGATVIFALASDRVPQTTHSPAPVSEQLPPIDETKEQHKARLEAEGRLVHFSGPSTMGTTLTIADKRVKLPDDAYVQSYVVSVDCAAIPCPVTPAFVIRRGDSSTWVSQQTGARYRTVLHPHDSGVFAFLDEVLGP